MPDVGRCAKPAWPDFAGRAGVSIPTGGYVNRLPRGSTMGPLWRNPSWSRFSSVSSAAASRTIDDLPAPRRLPLVGHAHHLARGSRLHSILERWARRYGPIVRVDLGPRRLVCISDVEEINALLRDRPEGFRRWTDQQTVFEEMGINSVFTAEGEDWKRQRRLVVTALNTNHLHRYFGLVRTSTERLHRRLTEASQHGQPFDITDESCLSLRLRDDWTPALCRGGAARVDAIEDSRSAADRGHERHHLQHAHPGRYTPGTASAPRPSRPCQRLRPTAMA